MAVPIPPLSLPSSKSMPSSSAILSAAYLLKIKEDMKKEILDQLHKEDDKEDAESNFDSRVINLNVRTNPFFPLHFEDDREEFVPKTKDPDDGFISIRCKK